MPAVILVLCCLTILVLGVTSEQISNKTDTSSTGRDNKALSVFNVVTFPNVACGATTGYNGTCYTASECTSKGGTSSGSCASSFGVCCVFNLACGESTTQNNTYAIISSYSTSSDADPCTYTICKQNTDVCKLRIDFDTMVLAGPYPTTTVAAEGPKLGDCVTDTLTVSNAGGASPPIICGINTGQHMYVPASDACNTINIDVDTGTATTTRKWQIKVTQYECGNQMAPELDCLQYFTASSGTVATFNWDTSATKVGTTHIHLSNQYYDICFRRQRGYCQFCITPQIASTTATEASSYGLGSSSDGAAMKAAVGSVCTGITTHEAMAGYGDYLEIANLQNDPAIAGTITTANRICGNVLDSATAAAGDEHKTVCSFATPFKIGVHFDEGESVKDTKADSGNFEKAENHDAADIDAKGAGLGYTGFYLAYEMKACT